MHSISKESSLSFAVIGAGALGCFYGAKLVKAGFRVQFQSRSATKDLKGKTLKIKSVWGGFSIKPDIHLDAGSMSPADILLLSTKALPDINYKKLLSPLMTATKNKRIVLICLQNGIGQEERLQKMFPNAIVIGALAFACIQRKSFKEVHHIDYGYLKIAPLDFKNKDAVKSAEMLQKIFISVGVGCELGNNLRHHRWEKLLWNVPFNPLSVILGGANTSQMMKSVHIERLITNLMKEVASVARQEGIRISSSKIKEMLESTKKMKPYKTSMLLDYELGKPLETEAIVGEVLKVAKKKKVATPKVEMLYHALKYFELA